MYETAIMAKKTQMAIAIKLTSQSADVILVLSVIITFLWHTLVANAQPTLPKVVVFLKCPISFTVLSVAIFDEIHPCLLIIMGNKVAHANHS